MHKVSIIIPCYNEEDNIAACLDSVCNINNPQEEYEVILVDNGSTDKTIELAESYPISIIQDKSRNVSGLRNLGAASATGDILAFVDADCIVDINWISSARTYFDQDHIAAWGAPAKIPQNATWVQKAWYIVRKRENPIQEVEWLESMNLFVRKKHFISIGGFDESLVTCEDVDFSYRIRRTGKIISDQRISVIHLGEASTIKEFIKKETWRGMGNLKGMKRHGLKFEEVPSLIIPIYFGLVVPLCFFLMLFTQKLIWFMLFTGIYLLPSIGAMIKIRKKNALFQDCLGLFVLLQFYFFSRTISVFKK